MRNVNIDRTKDESQEQIINQFLEKYYFQKTFRNVRFITDTALQTAGVDFLCDNTSIKDMKIDVKAQSSAKYLNNPRPTFSLEVTTLNRYGTEEITGWFFSSQCMTEYYTFVWILRANVDKQHRIRHVDDIERLEVLTVNAHDLQDYIDDVLEEHHLDDIYSVSQDMRWREKTRIDICKDIHYSHSPHLVEKPVNLVVHKRLLKTFAIPDKHAHCIVTKDEINPVRQH